MPLLAGYYKNSGIKALGIPCGFDTEKTLSYIGGYLDTKELADIDSYIVPASLGDDQGILGALKLAFDEDLAYP